MDTPEKVVYTATATSTGGRDGRATTDDGKVDVALSTPTEMGGNGSGTNPEQLFAAGYSACFNSALGLAAHSEGVRAAGSTVTATVGIGPHDASFALDVTLEVRVPGLSQDQVQALADKAHQLCPYSKATRGNINVTVTAAS